MSALFRGFATGVLEGTSDFLQREDIRVQKQTDDALKEFTARVEQQRKDRRAYKDKVEDAIGEVVSRGYSLNTASGMIQDFGIPGTINILKNADEAVKFGNATYENFITEVKGAKDEASEQTAAELAQNLAATKFPKISESTLGEGMDVRPPLSGSIAGRFLGDTGEEEDKNYRDTLLAGLADSLPDQSRGEPSEEFKIRGVEAKNEEVTEVDFEPQFSSFSVNRNLMPTDEDRRRKNLTPVQRAQEDLGSSDTDVKNNALMYLSTIAALNNPEKSLFATFIKLNNKSQLTSEEKDQLAKVKKTLEDLAQFKSNTNQGTILINQGLAIKRNIQNQIDKGYERKDEITFDGTITLFTSPEGSVEVNRKKDPGGYKEAEENFNKLKAAAKIKVVKDMNLNNEALEMFVLAGAPPPPAPAPPPEEDGDGGSKKTVEPSIEFTNIIDSAIEAEKSDKITIAGPTLYWIDSAGQEMSINKDIFEKAKQEKINQNITRATEESIVDSTTRSKPKFTKDETNKFIRNIMVDISEANSLQRLRTHLFLDPEVMKDSNQFTEGEIAEDLLTRRTEALRPTSEAAKEIIKRSTQEIYDKVRQQLERRGYNETEINKVIQKIIAYNKDTSKKGGGIMTSKKGRRDPRILDPLKKILQAE